MAVYIKSLSEIAYSMIANIHDKLPEVDTKEGTFVRDVFVDPTSKEINDLYVQIKSVDLAQSILTASGNDLDRLAGNYFVKRKPATPSMGTIRFYLGTKQPQNDIFIPIGTSCYTQAAPNQTALYFQTTQAAEVLAADPSTYGLDPLSNQYYIDVPAMSSQGGSQYNIPTGTISQVASSISGSVTSVTNPLPFTGGTDAESDISLALRVSLAITGSNIGTKDGYLSFILRQPEVSDSMIVGAGDPLMTRDIDPVTGLHNGGMVDIYVRTTTNQGNSDQYVFNVTYDYTIDTVSHPAYYDIVLPNQPVISVYNIVGVRKSVIPGNPDIVTTYLNGSNYKTERGTNRYYYDTPWNFTPVSTDNLRGDDLLKAEATNALSGYLKTVNYLSDYTFDINWNLIVPTNDNLYPLDPYFYRGFYTDGAIYMIESKSDPNNPHIGGRFFVQKDGLIYERQYVQPSFILLKDTGPYGRSSSDKCHDVIRWLPNQDKSNLPAAGEQLTIQYNWNGTILDLQNRLEPKRILTADVLIKEAIRVGIQIKCEVVPYPGVDPNQLKNDITNRLTAYVNDLKKLNGEIDRSDIVYIVHGTTGVDAVNIDDVYLARTNQDPVKQISLGPNEYMEVDDLFIKILPPGTYV